MDRVLKLGIVGCGLIGAKRAAAVSAGWELVGCADVQADRARRLAGPVGALATDDWRELLAVKDLDAVVVSTLHDSLAEITLAAVRSGKHVLVEKPAARNPSELRPVIDASAANGVCVRVGFNHRFHRAFRQAREIVASGVLGELMFIRGRYGHGGRLGYDREWRADPAISGGGELIDQGPHLIDLSRWFFGADFTRVQGVAKTLYWDMPVDDNAFMLLQTASGKPAFLHVSCSEWKNLFSMEIYGRGGKLDISGLGGSYGLERLTHYHMLPEMGPPETTAWEYPMGDDSWKCEMQAFRDDILLGRRPDPGLGDAFAVLEVIQQIYGNQE